MRAEEHIDSQAEVKVYRLNPDGSKGEFLRTMPAYPEGWDERRFVPGAGGKKKEKEEDDSKMARVRKDKEKIMAKARPMLAEGLSIKKTAKELDVPTTTLFQWVKKEEEQTLPPEPDELGGTDPIQEEKEPAENSIPYSVERLENIGREINPDDDTKIYTPERQNYTITQYNEQIKQDDFTAADEEPIPYTPVENPFDLNRFKIAVLEIFQEVARANQAPAYVSLAFMNAIIDTYPEKGE